MASIIKADVWQTTAGTTYKNVINTYVVKNTGALYSTTAAWAIVPGLSITRNFTVGNLILCMCETSLRTQGAQSHPGLTFYINGANVGDASYGLCIAQQAAGAAHSTAMITHSFIATQASNSIEFWATKSPAGQDNVTFGGEAAGGYPNGYKQCRLIVMEIAQ